MIQEWEVHPSVTFSAVVEKCQEKKDSFLCNYPLKYYKQESLVPIIIGMNSGEGGFFASRKLNIKILLFFLVIQILCAMSSTSKIYNNSGGT